MCILFISAGAAKEQSDYTLILASNRDEFYERASSSAHFWKEDNNVIGGRDLEAGGCGTWFAISAVRRRLGVLLNLPGQIKEDAKSRGNIVEGLVKSDASVNNYIETVKCYGRETNDFNLITVEFESSNATIKSYNNVTEKLETWTKECIGFSNSLPDSPLMKVKKGEQRFRDICNAYNKIEMQDKLIEELVQFLKWDESHLPDPELQRRRPNLYKELSSVYVSIPEGRYGTRTHSIVLVTKTGKMRFIELTMQEPIDLLNPSWKMSEFYLDL